MPVIIIFLYINELTGNFVTNNFGLDQKAWEFTRMMFVVGYATLRVLTFREELQFRFD